MLSHIFQSTDDIRWYFSYTPKKHTFFWQPTSFGGGAGQRLPVGPAFVVTALEADLRHDPARGPSTAKNHGGETVETRPAISWGWVSQKNQWIIHSCLVCFFVLGIVDIYAPKTEHPSETIGGIKKRQTNLLFISHSLIYVFRHVWSIQFRICSKDPSNLAWLKI